MNIILWTPLVSYRLVVKNAKQRRKKEKDSSLNRFVVVDNDTGLIVLELFCVSWRIEKMSKYIDVGNHGYRVGKMKVKSTSKEKPCRL